ncbi:hypothetical protein [Endothiovibrio diazotrophicus]
MRYAYPPYALLLAATLALPLHAAEFTGRLSLLGAFSHPGRGEAGYTAGDHRTLTADQQALRLMLDGTAEQGEWSFHLKGARQRLQGYATEAPHSSQLFRYRRLAGDLIEHQGPDDLLRFGVEVDRAYYRHRFGPLTVGLGRQPLDWGAGRLWQPLNLFGAFAPTDLDTDYKPGIDGAVIDWYPSPFSSLTAALVLSPDHDPATEESGALHYRRQVGELSELSLAAGRVNGDQIAGGAFESAWGGMGWRVEGSHYQRTGAGGEGWFWIAGVDYQFDDGTLLTVEGCHHDGGASDAAQLAALISDHWVGYGLQPQLGRQVLGVALERDLTPLLKGSYTLLDSFLDGATSQLHQFNLTYSLSNESDLLLSLTTTRGKGADATGALRSEFGHLPTTLTLRYRVYF